MFVRIGPSSSDLGSSMHSSPIQSSPRNSSPVNPGGNLTNNLHKMVRLEVISCQGSRPGPRIRVRVQVTWNFAILFFNDLNIYIVVLGYMVTFLVVYYNVVFIIWIKLQFFCLKILHLSMKVEVTVKIYSVFLRRNAIWKLGMNCRLNRTRL